MQPNLDILFDTSTTVIVVSMVSWLCEGFFLQMIGVIQPSTHQGPVGKLRIGLAVLRSSNHLPGIPLSQYIPGHAKHHIFNRRMITVPYEIVFSIGDCHMLRGEAKPSLSFGEQPPKHDQKCLFVSRALLRSNTAVL